MKIAELYRMLCSLYGIDSPLEIEHFLICCSGRASDSLIGNIDLNREALLLRQSGEELELGLFVDPSILASIDAPGFLDRLDDLSCAAEGASHFLYVADRAEKGRSVSKLELELQGEVDKFLLIHLIAAEGARPVSPEFFFKQFEEHAFGPGLSEEDVERYATASHFAAKYCAHMRSRYFNPLRRAGLVSRAREFFHEDLPGKISRLLP